MNEKNINDGWVQDSQGFWHDADYVDETLIDDVKLSWLDDIF